jgi:hypothetical protein
MSAISGDKAKFNPQQKNKVARRTRTRATLKASANHSKSTHLGD